MVAKLSAVDTEALNAQSVVCCTTQAVFRVRSILVKSCSTRSVREVSLRKHTKGQESSTFEVLHDATLPGCFGIESPVFMRNSTKAFQTDPLLLCCGTSGSRNCFVEFVWGIACPDAISRTESSLHEGLVDYVWRPKKTMRPHPHLGQMVEEFPVFLCPATQDVTKSHQSPCARVLRRETAHGPL